MSAEQALREFAAFLRRDMGPAWGGNLTWFTSGNKVADLVASIAEDHAGIAEAHAPAEHGDTPDLTEQERESWVEFIVNVATFVMGAMAEQTVGARDRGDDWHERAAEEALDLFMPHVRELLSARSAATPEPWWIGGRWVTREDYLAMTRALGFGGDGFDDPAATPAQMIPTLEEWSRDASEWREHEMWRDDCYLAGHPDDEDCYEHDPHLRSAATPDDTAAQALRDDSHLCECDRPDEAENPHRHERDAACAFWLLIRDEVRALASTQTPAGGHAPAAAFVGAGSSEREASPVPPARTVTEWGTLDRWYDDPEVLSYGTEEDRPDGQDYARLDADRFGDHVVVVRRKVTPWVEANPGTRDQADQKDDR